MAGFGVTTEVLYQRANVIHNLLVIRRETAGVEHQTEPLDTICVLRGERFQSFRMQSFGHHILIVYNDDMTVTT